MNRMTRSRLRGMGAAIGFVGTCCVATLGAEPLAGLTVSSTGDSKHFKFEFQPERGESIRGHFVLPKGIPPFPVVIVNHMPKRDARQAAQSYAPRFVDRGFAAVTVDLNYAAKEEESDLPAMFHRLNECINVIEHDERFDAKRAFMFGNGPGAMVTLAYAAQTDKLKAVGLTGAGIIPKSGVLWEKISVPVILVHGETDQTVPLEKGLQLKANLERAGKTVEMKIVKNSGHEVVTLKAADVFDPIVDFFRKHGK